MRDEFKNLDLKSWHFTKKKDKKTGAISYDTSKDFAIYAMHKFKWIPSFIVENVTALTNGGAIVVVRCDLYNENHDIIACGLASVSSDAKNFDWSWHGQKSATFSFKYAVDIALGLTSGEIQEIVTELGLDKGIKTTSMSQREEPEPDKPENMPAEDDSLNAELLG